MSRYNRIIDLCDFKILFFCVFLTFFILTSFFFWTCFIFFFIVQDTEKLQVNPLFQIKFLCGETLSSTSITKTIDTAPAITPNPQGIWQHSLFSNINKERATLHRISHHSNIIITRPYRSLGTIYLLTRSNVQNYCPA